MPFYCRSSVEWVNQTMEAMRLIMPDVLERERGAAQLKWYGYRFMTPLAATRHFGELFRKGRKSYASVVQDRETAEKVRGLSPDIFLNGSGMLTQLWQARQRADYMGVPYDLLIDFGFHFASRRKWRFSPAPLQLFGTKNSLHAWTIEWSKYLEQHLGRAIDRLSGLPQYRIEGFRGLPAQVEFRKSLLEHLGQPGRPLSVGIGRQCIEHRHLPLRSALRLLCFEQRSSVISDIRRDLRLGMLTPAPREEMAQISLVPGCFGLPLAYAATSANCEACPFATECASAVKLTSARMVSIWGNASPLKTARDSRRRASGAQRQARFRAKKRTSNSAVPRSS